MSLAATHRAAFSPGEAADILGVSRNTIYLAIARGDLRVVKLGRRTLIPAEAIDALLTTNTEAARS